MSARLSLSDEVHSTLYNLCIYYGSYFFSKSNQLMAKAEV